MKDPDVAFCWYILVGHSPYAGDHAKTIVFGLTANDGGGHFERLDKFTKDEFVSFLKNACQKFGKLLMILDRAPQHRAGVVRDAPGGLNGQMKLLFLPAGCPDLSATEELWRQMRMVVLVGPYVSSRKCAVTSTSGWTGGCPPRTSTGMSIEAFSAGPSDRPAPQRGFCAQPCRIRRRRRIKPA